MYSTEESFARRWSRRAVTYSFVYLSLVLLVLTLPIWLPAALMLDAVRRTSWSATRAFLFAGLYLIAQAWAVVHSQQPSTRSSIFQGFEVMPAAIAGVVLRVRGTHTKFM